MFLKRVNTGNLFVYGLSTAHNITAETTMQTRQLLQKLTEKLNWAGPEYLRLKSYRPHLSIHKL